MLPVEQARFYVNVCNESGSRVVITGELKSKVDQLWNAFWSGGISNPLSVIEQITYLLFAKRIDDLHTAREKQSNLLGTELENPVFLEGQ